ncbi:MAG: STAS domain-containing protein [Chloroflexi bacterium]|nr:STAS domain-containing protein [Chloroflexota bacterium]
MDNLAMWLVSVNSPDEDVQRRGKLLIIIALGLMVLALALFPVTLATVYTTMGLVWLAGAAIAFAGVVLLGRFGQVNLGAYILIGTTLLVISGSLPTSNNQPNGLFFMILPVLCAGVLLPPVHVWGVLALAIVGSGIGFGLLPPEARDSMLWRQSMLSAPLLLSVVALITFLSARTTRHALGAAEVARAEAEAASAALATSNSSLEARVEERTAALRQAADQQRAVATQLQASLEAQQELNRVIAELAVPIIPISVGTLVVPVVGNIDSKRAALLLSTLLERVEERGARTVVLDITGVAVVDTQVAAALLRVASAARLMGAETLLVGIRPEVAQALVHLGVDLTTLRTAATLQDGLLAIGVTRSEHERAAAPERMVA